MRSRSSGRPPAPRSRPSGCPVQISARLETPHLRSALGLAANSLFIPLLVGSSFAQQIAVVDDAVSCPECRLVVGSRRLTIGGPAFSTGGAGQFIAPIGRARYIVGGARGAPEVFDSAGKHILTLGRKGKGPGEFEIVSAVAIGPADSVALLDPLNGRVQIFDPDLRFVRSFTVDQGSVNGGFAWFERSGEFAFTGFRGTKAEIGYTIHVFSPEGVHRRSINEVAGPSRLAAQAELIRLLHPLPNGLLAAVSITGALHIQTIDFSSGRTLRSWSRPADWFTFAAGPFRARVVSMRVDGAGLLWLLIAVVSPRWESGVEPLVIAGREHTYRVTDRNLVFDSVIEVIDLQTSRVVAHLRSDRVFVGLLPNGLLAAESGRIDEAPYYELFPVSLKQP